MSKSILTSFQKVVFEGICKEKFITDNFYFGGGTALSEFYLHHRYSEDFDFFSENEIPLEEIKIRMDILLKNLGIKTVEYRTIQSSRVFFLKSGEKEIVKTDFNYMPFKKFGRMETHKKLRIESILDIAIDKLDTILIRDKARDFVDFYFIQKKYNFDLDVLQKYLEERASFKTDPLYLAGCFLKIEKLSDFPKMIKPLSSDKLVQYFLSLAQSLRPQIVK